MTLFCSDLFLSSAAAAAAEAAEAAAASGSEYGGSESDGSANPKKRNTLLYILHSRTCSTNTFMLIGKPRSRRVQKGNTQ
jgi:hypothetical protein